MARAVSHLLAAGALLLGAGLGVYAAGPALGSGPVRQLAVAARPLPLNPGDAGASRIGRLRYLGGLALRADDRGFGGLSGMVWEPACGRLLAVTDSGSWIVLAPVEEGDRLVDVRTAWVAPILDPEGRPPASKAAADAEEVARSADGALFVSYEQRHRIEQFRGLSACHPETLGRPPVARHVLAEMAGWPANGGAEAMAVSGDGLLLLSETVEATGPEGHGRTGKGSRQGLRWTPGAPAAAFSWPLPADGGQPTAMDLFEDEAGRTHMLVLHRRASLLDGLSAVVSEALLEPGSGLPEESDPGESRVVARLRRPLTVDNMEAMAVRRESGRGESGRIFVYLASDDNFNRLQRTLLLKFELLPEGR